MYKLLIATSFLFALSSQAQIPESIAQWLSSNNGKLSARINQYNKDQYNLLINQNKFAITDAKQQVQFQQSSWEVSTKATLVEDKNNAVDYTVTFYCKSGSVDAASVSVDIDWNNWSEKNYVLLPSAAYNGNRYAWRRLQYSPKLYEIQDIGIDKPIILTDVPKLNGNGEVSRIQERSGDMACPSMGFSSDTTQKGMWLLTRQGNNLGDFGMDVAETRDRKNATFSITSPLVREQFEYRMCNAHYPSIDNPINCKAGDSIKITFRLYAFDAPNTQSIFDKYALIRKDFAGDNSLVNALPYSECMQMIESKFNKLNFVEKYGYYAVGFRENFLQDWQIGWTGGMISTYPLLFSGNEQTRQNVIKNFDWLYPNGISPSGFYWDCGVNGKWLGGDIRKPHTGNWHLIRKSGDAIWYITKQFMLMDKMGISVKASWKDGNQKALDAFVKLWNSYHQIGQFVNSLTGEIIVGGSSGGGIAPAGLALASSYYHNPNYLTVAKEIAEYYYKNFTVKGISCGGPGDAVQNFDSESTLGLLESYVTLYELTNDKKWITYAEEEAKQMATWVVSYNYQFSDTSAYGRAKIHTTGTVYANTQNKHTAPGFCTASGVGLLKLYRYTGNRFYLELLQDNAHNITQYLGHPLKPLGNMPMGCVSERVNMGDWVGLETIGYVLPQSTWAETSLMLTTIEVPGLYVETDKGEVTAFDNVVTKVIKNNKKELVISITNPTPTDATIKILAEKSIDQQKILGENALYDSQKIMVKAGETQLLSLKK